MKSKGVPIESFTKTRVHKIMIAVAMAHASADSLLNLSLKMQFAADQALPARHP